ncbi:MAG: ParB/RepB/Spo0J family partition protein [Oscillospiraceae bacterium]|jgi:ParB family chromosome partitioning protein|nr:ParB/RepB/Spo0J family partition protein [Oscillospiraceae bacterium]
MARGGLGSGLSALFEDNSNDIEVKKTLRISEIERNRQQPRKTFDEEAIDALSKSIEEHGILQPLVVRPYNNSYQLVAGERRYRAAKKAGLDEVPVIIRELSDNETMQIALIENIQRENLNPIEEAGGYKTLADSFGMTQEEIAKAVGKSRSVVANLMRLLSLPNDVRMRIEDGSLSIGHAKVLLSLEDETMQSELAMRCCDDKMTVRELERIVSGIGKIEKNPDEKPNQVTQKDKQIFYREVEYNLKEVLGRKVSVDFSHNKGKLTLEFYDEEDLNYLSMLLEKYNREDKEDK